LAKVSFSIFKAILYIMLTSSWLLWFTFKCLCDYIGPTW
jgi:hypothetical protein